MALVQKFSLLKRHAIAAPFYKAFDAQAKSQTSPLMRISYREEESIWVRAFPDRVTAIFSTMFKDETDVIIGKVFLQVRTLKSGQGGRQANGQRGEDRVKGTGNGHMSHTVIRSPD